MHDDLAVVSLQLQELAPDPDEIVGVLLLDADAGTNAGMHEQKISARVTVVQALQEQFVGSRQQREQAATQILRAVAIARLDIVGGERLQSS